MSNDESRVLQLVVACSCFVALATLGMGLRIYARMGITKNVGFDDATLFLAWMLQVLCAGFILAQTIYGLGRHINTVTESDLKKFLMMVYGSLFAYNISLTITKVSILLQYLRFLRKSHTKTVCYIVLALTIMYGCATVAGTLVICLPVGSFWDTSGKGHCLNRVVLWLRHASLNITSDIIIILLPIPVVLKLLLPKKQRYGLVGIFAVGIVVCIISIVRLHSVVEAAKSRDLTWANAHAAILSQAELSVAIFCASLPGMKPLIKAWTWNSDRTDSIAETNTTEAHIFNETGPLRIYTNDLPVSEMEKKESNTTISARSSNRLITEDNLPPATG